MMMSKFSAMVVEEGADKRFTGKITPKALSDLPEDDVLIKVHIIFAAGVVVGFIMNGVLQV